jgi:hypothetical protein
VRLPDVSKESLSHADDSETQSEEADGEADVEGGRKAESREEDEEEVVRDSAAEFSARGRDGMGR